MAKPELNEMQKKFAYEYSLSYNATDAYMKVYKCKYTTANCLGPKLSRDPRVIEEVKRLQKEHFDAQVVTYERIAQELSNIAFGFNHSDRDKLTALNLLQKQMGLDKTTISADVNQKIEIKVGVEDDGTESETE